MYDLIKLLLDNLGGVIVFGLLFGGSIAGGLQWLIKRIIEHRENMQKMRIKELEFQLEIMKEHKPKPKQEPPYFYEESNQSYNEGYQQQQQAVD